MGKPKSTFPPAGPRRQSPWLWIAAGALCAVLGGAAVYLLLTGSGRQAPLPENPVQQIPDLPTGPSLPTVRVHTPDSGPPLTETHQQPPPAGPPLPQANVQLAPSQPLPQVTPAAPAPPPSGQVTWEWALYPVNPSVLGVAMGDRVAGSQFVALGVTIHNQSTVDVPVDYNAFRLVIDGRVYTTDVWSSGGAVIEGFPFLNPATMRPNTTMAGFTGYMIPQRYQRVAPEWQTRLPATVTVVRIDPAGTGATQ